MFVTLAWVQHSMLLRHARKVSRLVTVLTVTLVMGPCFLPLAATAAMDGFVAEYLAQIETPAGSQPEDLSVIYGSVIGLALPAAMLYFGLVILISRLVIEKKVGAKVTSGLPVTLSYGFLVTFIVLNLIIIACYALLSSEGSIL